MGNNNSNLQSAKNTKDDEFYTTYEKKSFNIISNIFVEKLFCAIVTIHSSRIFAGILYEILISLVLNV